MFSIPLWFIIAGLAGFASNIFAFFNRYLLKDKDDPTVFAWYFETLRFVVCFVIAIFFDWKLTLDPRSILIFILLGLSEWISSYFFMRMHAHSHLSISSILSRMRLIWVPIFAFFLIAEKLTISEYIGIAVLFAGLSTVVAPRKFFIDKGATYANLSAFFIAFNVVLVNMALPFASNSIICAAMSLPSVILFPLFMKNERKRIITATKHNFLLKTGAIGINIISLYLIAMAFRLGDASKVNAIYQGTLIFAVLAGIIFLKERENIGRKLIGTFITLIGVLLLSST